MSDAGASPLLPDVELRYSNLCLSATIPDNGGDEGIPDLIRLFIGAPRAFVRRIQEFRDRGRARQGCEVKLLDNISGVIIPGRLTLVLGAPGSGKSSYLKAITNRLANKQQLRGTVHYSGLTSHDADKNGIKLGQLVQYVSQLDEHSPFLTVRETLAFVARNRYAPFE